MIYNKIIILISFIFLFGCETREEKMPVSLVVSTQSIVEIQAKKSSVKKPKIIITADIFSETDYDNENLIAEIISCGEKDVDDFSIACVTGSVNNQIIFPAIVENLDSLRVRVECPDKPVCYSSVFDTKDKKNKNVLVELVDGIILKGKALKTNNKPIEKFLLRAVPKIKNQSRFSPGQFYGEIITDLYGNFECPGLVETPYQFEASCENYAPIVKHVQNFSFSKCNVDFIFQEMISITISGKVFSAENLEPLADVKIGFLSSCLSNLVKKVFTDINGAFVFEAMRYPNQEIGYIVAVKDGYGTFISTIPAEYEGEEIQIKLKYASQILGTVETYNGMAVTGVVVVLECLKQENEHDFEAKYAGKPVESDALGEFVISNVAAPGVYKFLISSDVYSLVEKDANNKVTTKLNQPSICNLILYEEAKIFIKVIDEEGNSVPEYHLRIDSYFGNEIGIRDLKVDQTKEEWHRVMPYKWRRAFDATISFKSRYKNMLSETIKDIPWGNGGTEYFVLTLHPQEPQITGKFYYQDGSPVPNEIIYAKAKKSCDEVRVFSDEDGYFEIFGLEAGENEIINLSAEENGAFADTNVINGSQDVPLRMQGPRSIIGRVFYGNLETPATNFVVREGEISFGDSISHEYFPKDGRFKIKPFTYLISGQMELFIKADGYAIKKVQGMIDKKVVCDVGNIILRKTCATLKGKVIDHLGNPLSTEVSLRTTDYNQQFSTLTKTNPEDGSYEFVNLPAEKVNVFAELTWRLASEKIGPILLENNETTIAPDIVVWTTNLIEVAITFILPDGNHAATSFVNDYNKITDSRGKVILWLPEGTHHPLNIRLDCLRLFGGGYTYENVKYLTESFDITPSTTHLTLQLEKAEGISGIITKEGKPFSGFIQFYGKNSSGFCDAQNGNFTIKVSSGKYYVICPEQQIVARLNLTTTEENNIDFKIGTGKIDVLTPIISEVQWNISINYEFPGYCIMFYSSAVEKNTKQIIFDNLPPGEYSVSAQCFGKNATNLWKTVTIGEEEHKNVSF